MTGAGHDVPNPYRKWYGSATPRPICKLHRGTEDYMKSKKDLTTQDCQNHNESVVVLTDDPLEKLRTQ